MNPLWPRSWQGIAVMLALVAGLGSLKLEPDHLRAGIAGVLMIVAFFAIVYLTWGRDED